MAFYRVDRDGAAARLVEADNPAQALKHVSADVFKVSEALSTGDVADLMDKGVKREKAGEAPPAKDAGGEEGQQS